MKGDIDSPCKGCTERYLACHDHCSNYQSYRKTLNEKAEMVRNCKKQDKMCNDHVICTIRKMKKKKGK